MVDMEFKRGEELKQRREAKLAELAAAKMSVAVKMQSTQKVQVWAWRQKVQQRRVERSQS